MKELSIEEKAKAYDESIERMRSQVAAGLINQDVSEYVFPELAESEDEKIRKELLKDIPKAFPCDKAFKYIAWLEKQSEQKSNDNIKRDWYNKGYLEGRKNAHIPARELELPKEYDVFNEQKTVTDLRTWKYIVDEVLTKYYGIGQYIDNTYVVKIAADLQKKYSLEHSTDITDDWIEDYWKYHKVNNPDSYDKGDEIQFDYDGFKRFCGQFKQRPVEWSEEDEKILNSIINVLEVMPSANFIPIKRETMIPWLESLKDRNFPHPK